MILFLHEYVLYEPGTNGQICAKRSLRSPTAADGRTALCHFLSASLASAPLSSQSLEQQNINWTSVRDLITF